MHHLDLRSGNNRVVILILSIKSWHSSVCFVTISISLNMCCMKFYFHSTKVICHELLFLILVICSEIQCVKHSLVSLLCWLSVCGHGSVVWKEILGYLVQPLFWSRSVAKARSIQPRLCLPVSWSLPKERFSASAANLFQCFTYFLVEEILLICSWTSQVTFVTIARFSIVH